MASNKTMFQRPVFWIAVTCLGVVAFAVSGPEPTKPKTGAKTTAKKKPVQRVGDVVFTKEDETASFNAVNDSPRNAFVPIVARHGGIGSGDGLANAIPTDMTGGESNWVYTGTATTDGVAVALIENRTTGDAVFLKRGERWKSAYVLRISEYSVIMSGPSGTHTLGLVDENLKTGSSSLARAQDFAPAQVDVPGNFRGRIGGGRRANQNGLSAVPTMGDQGQPGYPANSPNFQQDEPNQ